MNPVRSVTSRVFAPALVLSLVIGLLALVEQLTSIAVDEQATAENQLDRIGAAAVPNLEQALWSVNEVQVISLVDGVSQMRWVAQATLIDENGRRIERGAPPEGVLAQRTFELRYAGAEDVPLGTFTVVIDDAELHERLWRRGTAVAITLLLAMGGAAAALWFLFRRRVAHPLARITAQIEHFSLREAGAGDDDASVLIDEEAARTDEIRRLALALSTMRRQVGDDLREIEALKDEISAHRDRLEAVVQQRTAELEEKNLQLEAKRKAIERLANTDALTGALSRRHFLELAERERARADRDDEAIATLVMDIDHFKQVNDTYGHAGGDAALREFTHIVGAQLRSIDLLGRLGGEEFGVVIAPDGTDAAAAKAVAERIRGAVEAALIRLPDGRSFPMTVSIGLALRPARQVSIDDLLAIADEALCAAKRDGRNRVVVADGY